MFEVFHFEYEISKGLNDILDTMLDAGIRSECESRITCDHSCLWYIDFDNTSNSHCIYAAIVDIRADYDEKKYNLSKKFGNL